MNFNIVLFLFILLDLYILFQFNPFKTRSEVSDKQNKKSPAFMKIRANFSKENKIEKDRR
jgi:hypothetical protein